MNTKSLSPLFLALCAAPAALYAGNLSPEQGRAILAAHQDSVLPFYAVVNSSASAGGRSMPGREQTTRGVGVVLTDDGLIVTALSSIDPASIMNGQKIATANGRVELNVVTQIKELKIVMPDGLEISAGVVMKDTDLDLAFFRPKAGNEDAKDAKFHPIDLTASGPAEALDDVLLVNRLGKAYSYQPSGAISEVTAKTEKPRPCYHVIAASGGAPVFTIDGKLLGIGANRKPPGDDPTDDPRTRAAEMMVVLPAAEILRTAEQAKKAPAPTEDAPSEPEAKPDGKGEKPEAKEGAAAAKPEGAPKAEGEAKPEKAQ